MYQGHVIAATVETLIAWRLFGKRYPEHDALGRKLIVVLGRLISFPSLIGRHLPKTLTESAKSLGSYLHLPVQFHRLIAMADPKTVADHFAEHFASVTRKDSDVTGARHRWELYSFGVNFASIGGFIL